MALFDTSKQSKGLFAAPAQKKSAAAKFDLAKSNATMLERVKRSGAEDPMKPKGPSVLDRIFGALDTLGTGTRSIVHNAVNAPTDADVNPLQEMGKALKGEARVEGSHILGDVGVSNKWGKMLGGIALDIALDPLTYVTNGLKSVVKAEAAVKMAKLAVDGVDAARLADAGVDITRLSKEAQTALQAADAAGEALRVTDLAVDDTRAIATAIRKAVGKEFADGGGVKFAGISLGGQGAMEKATYAAKDALRKVPGSGWFERAFTWGDATDLAREGNELLNTGIKVGMRNLASGRTKAVVAGSKMEQAIRDLVPDAATRDALTLGMSNLFGKYTEQGTLRAANEAVQEAIKAGDSAAIEAAQHVALKELQDAYNPAAIREAVTKLGVTDPEQLAKVDAAAELISKNFDDLLAKKGAAGLSDTALYFGADQIAPTTTREVTREVPFERVIPGDEIRATEVTDWGGGVKPPDVPNSFVRSARTVDGVPIFYDQGDVLLRTGRDSTSPLGHVTTTALGDSPSGFIGTLADGTSAPALFDNPQDAVAWIVRNNPASGSNRPMRTVEKLLGKSADTTVRGMDTVTETLTDVGPTLPRSAGYMPGRAPIAPLKADTAAANDVISQLTDADPTALALPERNLLAKLRGMGKVGAEKSKEYRTIEERLVKGGLLTELDAAKLAGAKTTQDYSAIALQGFRDDIGKMLGVPADAIEQASPEMGKLFKAAQTAFTDDEAFKGALGAYDKFLNLWKRWATVYRLPAFPLRNSMSNKVLQFFEGLFDPTTEAEGARLAAAIAKGNVSAKDAGLVDELYTHGVVTTQEQLSQQIGERMARSSLKPVAAYEGVAGGINEFVENQSRIAAYLAARKQGATPAAAGMMVDKALYNYSPEALTTFERGFMKRIVPFWTWTSQNAPHMAEVLAKSPGKMAAVFHAKEVGEDVNPVDASVMPEWLANTNPIPTPLRDKNGNVRMLATEGVLPIGDLERMLTPVVDPKGFPKEALGQLSPIIKTPLELIFNKDLYYNSPISNYKGDARRAPAYVEKFDDLVHGLPFLKEQAKEWDKFKSAFGIVEKKDATTGEPYIAMNAYAVKALKDLNPWLSAMGKLIDDQPKTPDDRFSYATGIKTVSYDTPRFKQQKDSEAYAELRGLVARLKAEGKLAPTKKQASKKKSGVKSLLGGK